MLKKVNLKKQILISVIFLGLTTGLFALAIFGSTLKSFLLGIGDWNLHFHFNSV